jgi:hypothetical protein
MNVAIAVCTFALSLTEAAIINNCDFGAAIQVSDLCQSIGSQVNDRASV